MNNNSNNYGDCGTTCSECGRPWAICKQDGGCGCNKCKDIKFCEYGRMANGCIREKQPGCPMQAVIPSVTVESIEGIKNLADCLVHVSDINTTFYIDDKHRPIITWAGPIDIPGYDMEGNPNNYRDQIVTDVANQIAVIYDKSGKGYLFGLAENIDLQEQVNNKLDEMAKDGSLQAILKPMIDAVQEGLQTEYDEFAGSVNSVLQAFRNDIEGMTAGTPVAVSSAVDMTDHNKIYVLTSDGYWYYWDGDSWERGGVYQATALDDFSVTPVKTSFSKRTANLIDLADPNVLNAHPSGGKMNPTGNVRSCYIECEPNTTYTVSRSVNSGRFGVATCANEPTTTSGDIHQTATYNSDYYFKITTSATAHYLIVYYWNANYSVNTADEALEDLCIVKGITEGEVIPSYTIDVETNNLADSAVTPIKTSFNKNSSNLFNKDGANIINCHPNAGTLHSTPNVRSIYIPCEGSTSYVIKKVLSSRFAVYTTSALPADGVSYIDYKVDNTGTQIKITTDPSANYLCVFLWNNNYDTLTPAQIMDTLVITKGTEDIVDYIPYGKIIKVTSDNLDDGIVTEAKLSAGVRNAMSLSGSFASRNGIYGVEWDITTQSSACTRIGNAVGLENDYIVEDTYQKHSGVNDFDNIFPWCDIRRCNVSVSSDGTKSITYEGETGFALDGSNGNVMVEIPKFYSMRERIGNTEKIAISGEPKSGFNVEPAFLVDGKEQDFIYVACYHQAPSNNGAYSYTGSYPTGNQTLAQNISALSSSNLQSYDFTVYLMLQKLMIIEFADRSVQQYLGGMTRLPYWTANTDNVIDGFGTNYITFQENVGQGTMKAFWVGERIRVGDTSSGENSMTNVRTITAITKNGTQYKVEYDGNDMSASLNIGDGVGCVPQKNGWCDSLTYHTGRRAFATDTDISNYVSPMRYRYIENVIGNVWEQLAGIRVKGLTVHYSFEPNFNEAFTNAGYKTLGYSIPLQNQHPSSNKGWILKDGYDVNNRLINLPSSCGASGGQGKYMGGTFYSKDATDVEFEGVCCGAWDAYYWANINTLRVWEKVGTHSNLYGNRPIYRG